MLAEEGGLIMPMFVHQVLAERKSCTGYTPQAQNFNLNFEDAHLPSRRAQQWPGSPAGCRLPGRLLCKRPDRRR